ncbi:MAG: membrane protein insertion efficiency factor YidD [Patescibacteria group bacterium]
MKITNAPRRAGQLLIIVYQHTLSMDHGPLSRLTKYRMCIYDPTCSEFGYEAIGKYGLLKGSWLTAGRLLRCTPWHLGGHDPVP